MKATKLTAERLRQVLHYGPETGVFTWKVTAGRANAGSVAGKVNSNGHRYIGVFRQPHLASRLAWLYVHGEWPSKPLRHINYRSDDSRIDNLKLMERVDSEVPLTAEQLRGLLHYAPETGVFTWRVRHGKYMPGQVAGSLNAAGYEVIGILGKRLLAHRLAWLYTHGEWPNDQIDHINRTQSDNRIANLRIATGSENLQNTKLSCRNKSGHKGVIWYKRDQVWRAFLVLDRQSIHLGYYKNIDDAVAARKIAEAKYHPFAAKEATHA